MIAKRLDSKTIETHSGSVYKLKGGIDEDEAAEAGIPEELIEEFTRGFPENWEQVIQPYLQDLERQQKDTQKRRQSFDTTTAINIKMNEEEDMRKGGAKKMKNDPDSQMDDTDTAPEEMAEDEDRLKDAKKRRSIQKGRKSMMQRLQPVSPIEEEEEEERLKMPARNTPARGKKASETPLEMKTPRGKGRKLSKIDEESEKPEPSASTSRAARTPKGSVNEKKMKKTPKGREKRGDDDVYGTTNENPRAKNDIRDLSLIAASSAKQRQDRPPTNQRRVSLDDIPREIMEKSIPLSNWIIRFVRGGTNDSIFPHFQFKICGFRQESDEQEWSTSVIKKVVPPYIMFTSSSIYRLEGPLDVDQSTDIGFPPFFITDFLMGFPDDWEEKLETFFNMTFGPPPQPRIVELMSDGGTADDGKVEEREKEKEKEREKVKKMEKEREKEKERERENEKEKEKKKEEEREKEKEKEQEEVKEKMKKKADKDFDTPRNSDGQKLRVKGHKLHMREEKSESPTADSTVNRKRKEPTPSSSSDNSDESDSDEEEKWRRAAKKVEREMRKEELRAELRAKKREEKKKRFEVTVNRTPDGVPISRSGRTLRTPMATWAGENITYDVRGNVVEMTGVTTTTKLTVGKTNKDQNQKLAAHFGMDSPMYDTIQQERAIAPPTAYLPKTPLPKKSVAENRGYSDDETDDKFYYDQYKQLMASQSQQTPVYILKNLKRRLRKVESSDSEEEAVNRKKEEKRKRKEERRRLRESEEEESSDGGWRKKKSKPKKKVTVKKEKTVKPCKITSKKIKTKKEESEEDDDEVGSDLEIEHDEDAVTFVPSEDGSNGGGNGYSDDEMIESEKETTVEKKKKQPVKRAKVWKKEEIIRLKLAIQAANLQTDDATKIADGWEIVAKSLGGDRSAEECRKIARERLKMKVDEPRREESESDQEDESERGWSGAESGAASEDDAMKKRRKDKMGNANKMTGVTANKGTIQYAVEMENKKREMMMGGTSSQDDFFKSSKGKKISHIEALPSAAQFDADDSLLSCFDELDEPQPNKQRTTKTAMAAAASTPRLEELSSYEDSPGCSTVRRSARRSSTIIIPSPVIDQNNLTRYVHHLSRAKNISMLSKSMATDRSRMLPPANRGRNVARVANAIEKVENSVRNRRRNDNEMGDLDEDEENDNNILPRGF